MILLLLFLCLPPNSHQLPTIINTSIACDKTDFLLRIKFNETFTGLIQTEKGEPNCVYVNASIQRGVDYEVKIPLIGCETRRSEDGNYENEIAIQNGDEFDAKADKRYLLTCIPASPVIRDSQVTVSFGGITIDSTATTAISLVNSTKVEYEVAVRDGNDLSSPELKRPLLIGDRVTYTVHLGPSSNGRIGRCWASDGKSELDLSDNDGCSLQRAGEVWGDFEVIRDDDGTTFVSHIKAWAFPTRAPQFYTLCDWFVPEPHTTPSIPPQSVNSYKTSLGEKQHCLETSASHCELCNEVNIFCNLHLCSDCTQVVCRNRQRRVPPVVIDVVTNSRARDDNAPPIPVRASFRLRRETATTTDRLTPPTSRHPNAAALAGRVISSALYLVFMVLIYL